MAFVTLSCTGKNEHRDMSNKLEAIRNEQNIPLTQPEQVEGSHPPFKSFAENPTQQVHPELLTMIIGLNERLANQSTTIQQLEQKQSTSNMLIDRLTSHNVIAPDTLRVSGVSAPSAPQLEPHAARTYPVMTFDQAQQILTNRVYPLQGLQSRNVQRK